MSHQETLRACEEFIASLTAAETHVRVMTALQLDFSSVLKVYRDSLERTHELLDRVPGPAPKAPTFVDLGGRDDTDEVLTNAVGAGAGSDAGIRIGGGASGQTTKNSPAVPIDDGPEGTTDDSHPLATDEVSVETRKSAVFAAVPEEEEEGFAAASSIKAAPMNDDVVIMEEDEAAATEVMSPDQARARALAMAAAEDAHDREPPTEESDEVDDIEIDVFLEDEEHTLVVAEERVPALPEDTTHPGPRLELPPEAELEEVGDQTSVNEVILSKAQATAERAPAQGGQKAATPPPAPGAVKPKVKARQGVDKGRKDAATAKFYAASAAIPTIRDETTPKPRAAAVRLGTEGQPAEMLGGEDDDEPIAIEGVEDEDLLDHSRDGLTLEVEEHEWEEEEAEEPEHIAELDAHHLEEVEEHFDASAGFTKDQVKEVMEKARRAAKQGNIEGAVNFFSDVLDADPDNVEAYIGRGRLYLDVGDYARAMSDFTVAEDLDHTSPEPQVAVGDLYFARKDYKKAIEYFDQALHMKPDHAMAFCRRGISHYYKKNFKQALADLNEAVKLDKDIPNIQTFVSMAKKKAGKPGK